VKKKLRERILREPKTVVTFYLIGAWVGSNAAFEEFLKKTLLARRDCVAITPYLLGELVL
jgi:hypothetical protein